MTSPSPGYGGQVVSRGGPRKKGVKRRHAAVNASRLSRHPENGDARKQSDLAEHGPEPAPMKAEQGREGNHDGQAAPDQAGFVLEFRRAVKESRAYGDQQKSKIGHRLKFTLYPFAGFSPLLSGQSTKVTKGS